MAPLQDHILDKDFGQTKLCEKPIGSRGIKKVGVKCEICS